jgi:hypothetical protein
LVCWHTMTLVLAAYHAVVRQHYVQVF